MKAIILNSKSKELSQSKRVVKKIILTVFSSFISAFTLHVLVIPADFAPGGIDGIATMVQKVSGFSAGWTSLIIYIPLTILGWFALKRHYIIFATVNMILSSLFLVFLQKIDFYQLYAPDEKLLIAIVSGALLGLRTGVMLKMRSSTGGIDIITSIIQKKKPYVPFEVIQNIICCTIILFSFFVYHDVLCILVSFVQRFVFGKAAEFLLKDTRNAVEFKIVTKDPERIKSRIITELKHSATVLESKGLYSGDGNALVITVVNMRQVPEFLELINEDKSIFAYYSEAKGVKGNFRWRLDEPRGEQ